MKQRPIKPFLAIGGLALVWAAFFIFQEIPVARAPEIPTPSKMQQMRAELAKQRTPGGAALALEDLRAAQVEEDQDRERELEIARLKGELDAARIIKEIRDKNR